MVNGVKIVEVVPLHEMVLLVIFEDEKMKKYDVKLLAGRFDAFKPLEEKDLFAQVQNERFGVVWTDDIDCSCEELYEHGEDVTFEIQRDLLDEARKWCADRHITVEQLTAAFIEFCGEKANAEAVAAWIGEMEKKHKAGL